MSIRISSFSPAAICSGLAPYVMYGVATAIIHSICDALEKKARGEKKADFLPKPIDFVKHMTAGFLRLQVMNVFASKQVSEMTAKMVDRGLEILVKGCFEFVHPHDPEKTFKWLLINTPLQVGLAGLTSTGRVVDKARFRGDIAHHCLDGIVTGLFAMGLPFVVGTFKLWCGPQTMAVRVDQTYAEVEKEWKIHEVKVLCCRCGIEFIRHAVEKIFILFLIDKKYIRPVSVIS